ncbi:MAG: glycosyltransferase [Dehalococcoidales bacterium]|nr:glycosyltransferase [Dehalococcoidales bacterium]
MKVAYNVLNTADEFMPTVLARSVLQRWSKPPSGTALTWAHGHLVFRPEPWMVEVEYASLLLGPNPKHLKRFRHTLEHVLGSPYCRAIRCWCEAGRKTLVTGLDSHNFEHKIEVVYPAVPPKQFVKQPASGKIKLLFVGSANRREHFEDKGIRDTLSTFAVLCQKYDNIELVVRSEIPGDLKVKYSGMKGLKIIECLITREKLEREFQSADIFIIPCHSTPPFTILDAMSYELPVVSIDAWANPELIKDGKTGLLVEQSCIVPYYDDSHQPNFGTSVFDEAIRHADPAVTEGLVKQVSLLIENHELRRQLGRMGRWEVEYGQFSINNRNEKLRNIFDKATAGYGHEKGDH